MSVWRAMLTPVRTYNFSNILPKRIHNHIGSWGRKQYHFETYFGHKGYEKTKNRHFHAKFPLSPEISIWRGVNARTHLQLFSKHTLTVGIKLLPPAA